jgi:hypothetical protein
VGKVVVVAYYWPRGNTHHQVETALSAAISLTHNLPFCMKVFSPSPMMEGTTFMVFLGLHMEVRLTRPDMV